MKKSRSNTFLFVLAIIIGLLILWGTFVFGIITIKRISHLEQELADMKATLNQIAGTQPKNTEGKSDTKDTSNPTDSHEDEDGKKVKEGDNANLFDPTSTDMDGDGIPNVDDDDMDGDGTPNVDDDDMDGDGTPNEYDDDIDNPGDIDGGYGGSENTDPSLGPDI